jgi:ornithine cyclodeaminase
MGRPAVEGQYLLLSARDGRPLALIDGGELTARRTAAASALAASFLARRDASVMTMIGAGRLAPHLVRAHVAACPSLRTIQVWARRLEKARAVASALAAEAPHLEILAVDELESAVRTSDIVCAATLSTEPVIRGAWLSPGAHVDLVGGFTPLMREADDEVIRRARLFCDTLEGAPHEAGDLCQPIAAGLIDPGELVSLTQLCRGDHAGRNGAEEITLFKSVGCAAEDLAAAVLVYETQKNVLKASTTS